MAGERAIDHRRRSVPPEDVPLELDGEEPQRVIANVVTPSFFAVLGTHAALGQLFDESDGSGLGPPARLVLSYGLWQQRFGADPAVIGRVLSLNGRPCTVAGVPPAAFHHLTTTVRSGFDADLYVPLAEAPDLVDRSILTDPRAHTFGVIARLAPASSVGVAGLTCSHSTGRLTRLRSGRTGRFRLDPCTRLSRRLCGRPLSSSWVPRLSWP